MSVLKRVGSCVAGIVGLSTVLTLLSSATAGEVSYEYDDAARLKRVIYPSTTQRTYKLDAAGNRTNVDAVAGNGRLQFSAATANAPEGTTPFTITVTRTGSATGAVSVAYATASGTATSGSDFTATSGTLNWAASDAAAKTISVPVTNDSVHEVGETFTVTLSSPGGGAILGSVKQAVVTIVDNDPVTFSIANVSPSESATSVTLTVTKTGATTLPHSVSYATANGSATAGSDYTSKTGTLNFATADTSKTLTVTLLGDTTYEGDETFTVNLSAPTNGATIGTGTGTVTIIENDPTPPAGSISLLSSTASIAENGGTLSITVRRTGGSFGAASVLCSTSNGTATSGSDYTAVSQPINWANGDAANKTCSVPILDNTSYEGNETFTTTLSNVSGASLGTPASATVTIVENDPVPLPGTLQVVTTNFSISEAGGTFNLVIARVGTQGEFGAASIECATIGGDAANGVDYTFTSTTLNWGAGDAANKTCPIPILNDTVFEAQESFFVGLQNATGAAFDQQQSLQTVVIVDDDPVPPTAPGVTTWAAFQSCVDPNVCSTSSDLLLKWNAVSGATYYELEKAAFGIFWGVIYSGPALQFLDVVGNRSLNDNYRVRACNAGGCGQYSVVLNFALPF